MAFQFNNLYDFNTKSGVVVPDTGDIKTTVEQMMYTIFGADLDVTPETPVGRLVEAITMYFKNTLDVNAQNANQVNIDNSTGIYLDAIGKWFDLNRIDATHTRTYIKVTGTCAVVPAGSLMSTTANDVFYVENDITLTNGTGYGYALSQDTGAVPCDLGTLTNIISEVLGWETVINETYSPTYGTNKETDEDFRSRIKSARHFGASNTEAIANAIYDSDSNVSAVLVYENGTHQNKTENGVTMPPHSIYACVSGGNADTIAQAIYKSKTSGAAYTYSGVGNATVESRTITDTMSGQTYVVKFVRPTEITLSFTIAINRWTYSGTDLATEVKTAVKSYLRQKSIGGSITPEGIAIAISNAVPTCQVTSVLINGSATAISLTSYQIGATTDAAITVNVT